MIYSVQKPDKTFAYYEGDGTFPPIGQFRRPRGEPIHGLFPPSQYLPLLPSGTRAVGEGIEARGILSVMPMGLVEGLPEPVKRWAPPLALGFLFGFMVRSWRSKR